jgi:hypothetical protein
VAAAEAANAWSELQADDLKAQAEKLRADGFPPTMIRAIIAARIHADFAARRKALEAEAGEQPFWRAADQKNATALRSLYMEEQKIIKDLLGRDPLNGTGASLRRQFPGFAEETIDQLTGIRERYDEQRMEIFRNVRGSLLPEEQAKSEALDKAMRAEIAATLSPADFDDYQLRTSNVANQLRYELTAFDANEQEFRALFKLKSDFEDQWGYRSGMTPDQMQGRMTAQKQLDEQIKTALGPDRYTEYQRATDYNYRQTTQLVSRLNLPAETANTLYTIQKDFEQRSRDLNRSSGAAPGSAGWDTWVQQATALQQEALTRITPVIGGSAQNVDAYKQYGGNWITNMIPKPPPPRPGAPPAPTKSG